MNTKHQQVFHSRTSQKRREDEGHHDDLLDALKFQLVDGLLGSELATLTRDELLERAIVTGATIAPVYEEHEVRGKMIVRDDFFDAVGNPGLPFKYTIPAMLVENRR